MGHYKLVKLFDVASDTEFLALFYDFVFTKRFNCKKKCHLFVVMTKHSRLAFDIAL